MRGREDGVADSAIFRSSLPVFALRFLFMLYDSSFRSSIPAGGQENLAASPQNPGKPAQSIVAGGA
jgi:hypothetical protein